MGTVPPRSVVTAASAAVGEERVDSAFPRRPWLTLLATTLPELWVVQYLHVIEPRVRGSSVESVSNDFLRAIWAGKLWISAGGLSRDSAMKQADEWGELVAFGRYFTSNPDLPIRLQKNIPLTPYNRAVFYLEGSPVGYTDYLPADTSISAAA